MSTRKNFPADPADLKSNQRLLAHLHSEIEKVFQRSHTALPELAPQLAQQPEISGQPVERVSLKLFETDKGVDIECDLSGFDSEDVKVSAGKDCLVIEATTKESSQTNFYLGDPTAENFRKVIPLGFTIGKHSFRSQRRHGVLVVHVDKPTVGVAYCEDVIDTLA